MDIHRYRGHTSARVLPVMSVVAALTVLIAGCGGNGSNTQPVATQSTLKAEGAFTANSKHGDSLWGLLSDPTTDFGFDKLSSHRPGTRPPASYGGYPMGHVTRKIRASHDKTWPTDFLLTGFRVVDTGRNQELTYATEWGVADDGSRNGWVGWMDDENGSPTHVMASHAASGEVTLDSWVFALDGSISYLWMESGLSEVEISFTWLGTTNIVPKMKVVSPAGGGEVVVVELDRLWLAIAASSTGGGIVFSVDDSQGTASISFEMAGLSNPQWFGANLGLSGESEADAVARALPGQAIAEIQDRLANATAEWSSIQSEVLIPEEFSGADQRFVRLTVNHIASHTLYMPDDTLYLIPSNGGVNQHYWLRDSAITALGLSRFHPKMAANILEWLAAHPASETLLSWEWFNFDGTSGWNGSPNIDASAWLAMAIGQVNENLAVDDRPQFASNTRSLREQLATYVQDRWDSDSGHIDISPHRDHDWWDNVPRLENSAIDPREFKFKMGPEVLWIVGLRVLAPIYLDSGDSETADWITDVADTLELHLDDYQLSGGRGLSPAIDTAGEVVDAPGLVFVWGNVLAAAFLDRRSSYDALVQAQDVLRRPGLDYFTLQQAYYDDSLGSVESHSNLFEWLASGVDRRWGEGTLSARLRDLFDIPWAPRDHASDGSSIFIPHGLSYMMTAGFQLEALRFQCEGLPVGSPCP